MHKPAIIENLPNKLRTYKVQQIELIKNFEQNSRTHSEEQIQEVVNSINRYGYTNPILVDENNVIIAGHCRVIGAKRAGMTEIPTIIIDGLTNVQKAELVIADNKLALNAGWNFDILAEQITFIRENGGDVNATGWKPEELTFMADEVPAFLGDEDEVPEPPAEPVTKRGDVWILGQHRLMCGDSTMIDNVEKLMDGEKADMVYCDPPYGMNLDTDYSKIKGSKNSPNAKGYSYEKVIGDDKDFDPTDIINILTYCKEQFWWGCDYYFNKLPPGGSLLVWQKRDKADAEMIGNDFELCWSKTRHKKRTFWKRWVGFDSIERGDKRVHPTQKPIALAVWCFDEYGKEAKSVLDLFGGSGSTLIACEKTNRKCYMMELAPNYCDVIIVRWEKLTGKKAELENNERL
jgi:DNA modification methylase